MGEGNRINVIEDCVGRVAMACPVEDNSESHLVPDASQTLSYRVLREGVPLGVAKDRPRFVLGCIVRAIARRLRFQLNDFRMR